MKKIDFLNSITKEQAEVVNKILEEELSNQIDEVIKTIKKWMDFHQDKQATFSTDALISHLMKKFI